MNDKKNNLELAKIIVAFVCIVILIILVRKGLDVLKNISQVCIVEEGNLRFEETADGYVIRDETVLQGENCKNGMIQIISEGQRTAKDSPVFRYYTNGEDEVITQIATLDDEINAEIESSGLNIFSTDITNLEIQIEKLVDSMYNINYLDDIQDKFSELNTYISKKTKITGSLSPADSYVKSLIEQRNNLESTLSSSSEIIIAPVSGTVSYRVDGLEEILKVDDFSYLNTEFLNKLNTKSSSIISTNTEKGKIVNNFECYIACPMDTEKASTAQIGDKVILRLTKSKEVPATIEYIKCEDDDKRVIVFKVTDEVEELISYREIYVDVIWWSYTGLKVSNSSIFDENDISYVQRNKAGYNEKIYVKVLRQNDTYSIVQNYKDEELIELGFDEEYIQNRVKLNIYDEILIK